ncbi:ribose 5-phosphate isomerase B [Candidatus Latescibacterota bacterium]
MKVAIGSDHAGYDLKQFLHKGLSDLEYDIIDCGTDNEESVDYPDFARTVCDRVLSNEADFGIVICGTGIGVSISANKINGIRAALCHTEFSARMARLHNDANVLALGGRVLGKDLALAIAVAYLSEKFSGGERHKNRIKKMMGLENSNC